MEVTPQVENKLSANMNISKKDIVIGNFLGGLSWGIGSVVGAGVIVAVIGFVLNTLGVFTAIGGFFSGITSIGGQLQNLPQIPNLYK